MLYPNASMTVFLTDDKCYTQDCNVRLDNESVRIEYVESGERLAYVGRAIEPGHYELRGEGFDARATLHCFTNAQVLIGEWREAGTWGMWRFTLNNAR